MSDESEKFLSRWSRLKRDAIVAEPAGYAQAAPAAFPGTTAPLQRKEKDALAESPPPQLPPLDELTPDSDFRDFFHPKVAEDVKRAALKKLFSDPHFNVMDGLDTYIDDYSKDDPLPVEMLAQMKAAQKIFRWARNELEEGETTPPPLDAGLAPAVEASVPSGEIAPAADTLTVIQESKTDPEVLDGALPDPGVKQ